MGSRLLVVRQSLGIHLSLVIQGSHSYGRLKRVVGCSHLQVFQCKLIVLLYCVSASVVVDVGKQVYVESRLVLYNILFALLHQFSVASLYRLLIEFHSHHRVLLNAMSQLETKSHVSYSLHMFLLGSHTKPFQSHIIVLLHFLARVVISAESVLSLAVAFLGSIGQLPHLYRVCIHCRRLSLLVRGCFFLSCGIIGSK